MAGKNPGFDRNAFVKGIHFVMKMAEPVVESDAALFLKPSQLVYNLPNGGVAYVDQEGVPFDPQTTVTRINPPPIKVLCAVEYFDVNGSPTDFGLITPSRAAITLLDQEYALVKDAVAVVLKGEKYNYRHTEFPTGLFDVGVYTMHFTAEDQT